MFEKVASAFDSGVVKPSTRSVREFATGVQQWLGVDDHHRVLLLLDEADTFVRHEAETGFRCIGEMLQLMAETKDRFKFVLAGLHNVSLVQCEQKIRLSCRSPNNPLRIGPLIDRDVADAEVLVRGPLAAMGYEFDRREDVWRISALRTITPSSSKFSVKKWCGACTIRLGENLFAVDKRRFRRKSPIVV